MAADQLLDGTLHILGVKRTDLNAPDWFLDPVSGQRAPQDRYCFDIDPRNQDQTGNVKQVWELSRHHHLTVVSAAWFASGDPRYPEFVARHLRSWWAENPFLSGIHWTSGIEVGLRVVAWSWIRRLLDGWPGAAALFDDNDDAVRQIRWHQLYLATFRSVGSSANNHVVAEAAGQLVSTCAFPWFAESERWRADAGRLLERELERNTFPSGVNRELATDYHCFVAELGLVAAVEAGAAGYPVSDSTWARLVQMIDVAAAAVDERCRGPRQGDSDDGRVLVVDAPTDNEWPALLATGAGLFNQLPWWPKVVPDVRSILLSSLDGHRTGPHQRVGAQRRPSHFDDAGLTLLRTPATDHPEIWCRCDGGPHGYLSLAGHAHADSLSIEVRCGGVDVLADPGTYCYHGERQWRDYFRSTIGHNALELAGRDQSRSGGPFLWVDHASARLVGVSVETANGDAWWSAEHDGYLTLEPPALHRRTVRLHRAQRRLEIVDRVQTDGFHPCRLAFHFGPAVEVTLDGCLAVARWSTPESEGSATLALPTTLVWTRHRGEHDPLLGWYSPGFGRLQPAVTIVGAGLCGPGPDDLNTVVEFYRSAAGPAGQ